MPSFCVVVYVCVRPLSMYLSASRSFSVSLPEFLSAVVYGSSFAVVSVSVVCIATLVLNYRFLPCRLTDLHIYMFNSLHELVTICIHVVVRSAICCANKVKFCFLNFFSNGKVYTPYHQGTLCWCGFAFKTSRTDVRQCNDSVVQCVLVCR